RAQIVAPEDWISESEEEEGATEADKAKHERFRMMRKQHYHSEGHYVHKDASDIMDSDGSVDSDDDEHGVSSDDNKVARKPGCANGAAVAGRHSKPTGLNATYGQTGSTNNSTSNTRSGGGAFNRNFASNVDEANAADMDM
ncbi:hypothetical protein GGI21_004972, partial [Coemansia aciculifera]